MSSIQGPRVVVAASVLVLSLACGPAAETAPELGVTRAAIATQNGSNLNGSNLNGSNLNGSNLNGSNLNGSNNTLAGALYAGAVLGQDTFDSTALQGSMLVGQRGGQTLSGTDLLETEFNGFTAGGVQVKLKLDDIEAPATDGGAWKYHVVYKGADNLWYPVCNESAYAVAVAGRWDYHEGVPGGGAKLADASAFTFGCDNAAIGKCVRMGYRPWVSGTLDRHHQACVRLIRADYCGNGISGTTNGRWVNVYDAIGVQRDTESWLMEAEWTPDGARCVAALSRNLLGVLCNDNLYTLTCGASWHWSTGTLLMSETPSGPVSINVQLF